MRFIRQLFIVMILSFMGEALKFLLPFPIPASIYGLILMLTCLQTGILKLEQVEDVSLFLIDIMPLMFIPASAGLIAVWPQLRSVLLPLVIITLVSTWIVMIVSSQVTQIVIRLDKKGGKK